MTDNTQAELEKVLKRNFYMSESYLDIVTKELLDWHNKQIEEVLDRLESRSFGIKQDIGVSQYPARSVYEPEYIAAIHKVVPLSAIEAERNELKESK